MQDAADAVVDSVTWASPQGILFCVKLESDDAYMAILTWEAWDAATPGSAPEGLLVHRADPLSVSDAASSSQTPHMQALLVPQWGVTLAVHHNAYDYHMKVFGTLLMNILNSLLIVSLWACYANLRTFNSLVCSLFCK